MSIPVPEKAPRRVLAGVVLVAFTPICAGAVLGLLGLPTPSLIMLAAGGGAAVAFAWVSASFLLLPAPTHRPSPAPGLPLAFSGRWPLPAFPTGAPVTQDELREAHREVA